MSVLEQHRADGTCDLDIALAPRAKGRQSREKRAGAVLLPAVTTKDVPNVPSALKFAKDAADNRTFREHVEIVSVPLARGTAKDCCERALGARGVLSIRHAAIDMPWQRVSLILPRLRASPPALPDS
jgi:hypothetical protein